MKITLSKAYSEVHYQVGKVLTKYRIMPILYQEFFRKVVINIQ